MVNSLCPSSGYLKELQVIKSGIVRFIMIITGIVCLSWTVLGSRPNVLHSLFHFNFPIFFFFAKDISWRSLTVDTYRSRLTLLCRCIGFHCMDEPFIPLYGWTRATASFQMIRVNETTRYSLFFHDIIVFSIYCVFVSNLRGVTSSGRWFETSEGLQFQAHLLWNGFCVI